MSIKNKYIPKPIDTSNITLSKDIKAIITPLTKNTHEIWSKFKIQDGWVYGEKLNSAKKKTPDLVNFNELSNNKQKYDKEITETIIKTLIAMGFTISKSTY